jgi:type II secretory pathway pseudopilin PulG
MTRHSLCINQRVALSLSAASQNPLAAGLTLAEVLIAVAISGVLFALIGNALLNHMLDARRIENSQRLRELNTRINYLLTVEGSEAADVVYSPSIPASCTSVHPLGTSLFRLDIPKDDGIYGSATNVTSVFYYNSSDGDLIRCGALAKRNGVIDHDQVNPTAAIVSRGTTLSVIQSGGSLCGIESSSDRQVAYRLAFAGAGSSYAPPCTIARAKTIFVCNPATSSGAVGSDAQIGQCGT